MATGADPRPSLLGTGTCRRPGRVSTRNYSGLSVEIGNVSPNGMLAQMREASYGEGPQRTRAPSMLDQDPPDHTRLRRLVSMAFTPRAVDALRPRIIELVDELLDEMERARHVDLVEALAFPLPFAVIAGMLGTPPADHKHIRELTGILVHTLEPVADPGLVSTPASTCPSARGRIIAWAPRSPGWRRASLSTA